MVRRARREYRVPIKFTPLDERDGFEETVLSYTPEEAMQEASRCLDCHEICSLCVGVCPNMALMTYEMESVRSRTADVDGARWRQWSPATRPPLWPVSSSRSRCSPTSATSAATV